MKKKTTTEPKPLHIKPYVISLVIIIFLIMAKGAILNKEMLRSIITGQREVEKKPEETGFRLLEVKPKIEAGVDNYEYNITLKFSENISADDFDVQVNMPNFKLDKLVVESQPDTLWIMPATEPWVYNTPYIVTVTSNNPNKPLKYPIVVDYSFANWPGPPPGAFDDELRKGTSAPLGY